MIKITKPAGLISLALLGILTGCGEPQEPVMSFASDIQPILENNCLKCHISGGQGEQASGLNMTSYEALMKGTRFGPIIEPGSSISSTLVRMIEGHTDKSIQMPHGKDSKPLDPADIAKIKKWIDQGAKNN
jgi:hypothetical protein